MTPFKVTTEKTYQPIWVCKAFTKYGETFRRIRSTMPYKASECFKCVHQFEDNESVALAAFKNVGNKVLCEPCAAEISQ